MKYEFTITDKKHGQNQMRAGIIILVCSICFYLFGWFQPKDYSGDLVTILLSIFGVFIGIRTYQQGKKDRELNKGIWTFRVNQNGVYLSTPFGLTRHVTLNQISAVERIDIGDKHYRYDLVKEDKVSFDLSLPINIDFTKVMEIFEYYGIKIIHLSYNSNRDYDGHLKLKGRKYKKLNEGFEF